MTQSTWSPVESSELLSLSLDFSSLILSLVESSGVWSVRQSPTGLCGGEKSIGHLLKSKVPPRLYYVILHNNICGQSGAAPTDVGCIT